MEKSPCQDDIEFELNLNIDGCMDALHTYYINPNFLSYQKQASLRAVIKTLRWHTVTRCRKVWYVTICLPAISRTSVDKLFKWNKIDIFVEHACIECYIDPIFFITCLRNNYIYKPGDWLGSWTSLAKEPEYQVGSLNIETYSEPKERGEGFYILLFYPSYHVVLVSSTNYQPRG